MPFGGSVWYKSVLSTITSAIVLCRSIPSSFYCPNIRFPLFRQQRGEEEEEGPRMWSKRHILEEVY